MSERTHVPRGSLVGCQSKKCECGTVQCVKCVQAERAAAAAAAFIQGKPLLPQCTTRLYCTPPPLTLPGWCRFQWKPFGTVWSMIDFRYTERVLEVDGHWEHVVTLSTLNFGIDSNFYSLPSFSECDNREVRRNYFWETFFCFQLYRSRQ